jgi:hypothetical protein
MGFIRKQEEKMALRLLAWQYQRMDQPLPGAQELRREAARIVDEAHQIARQRGSNLVSIMKELVADIRRR